MAKKAKIVFSGLLSLLVVLVFIFAFSVSILMDDTKAFNSTKYTIDKTQKRTTINNLKVKIYDSEEELTNAIESYLSDKDDRLRAGFSTWSRTGTQCTIFVIDPETEEDLNTWGHEIAHCVYGHWHQQ